MSSSLRCVLFDLDGTLLDTAPDLAAALNATRAARNLAPLAYDAIRATVSHGSLAMARIGCEAPEGSDAFEQFRLDLLGHYADKIAVRTHLFDGMESLLLNLETRGRPWGIVTNKPGWLTEPLLQALDLYDRSAVVISGDTLELSKPHPAPLLLAADRLNVAPGHCVYVGDAERDITAAKAAGMTALAATYGYIGTQDTPSQWGADDIVNSVAALNDWLAAH